MVASQKIMVICLACLISSPSITFGGEDVGTARYAPWSGTFWPIAKGMLIYGPLTKYDHATGRKAAAWEYQKNRPGTDVPKWFGYCHAWASAAVMDREPIRTTSAWGINRQPLYFGIGDQKGMLTACHTADIAQHYGIRYSGALGEDPQDIYPDQLWRVLKLYVQQQGVPIIVDIEEGPEVWNYPVYAYRVAYRRTGRGSECMGEMSVLMADDAVPPDCIGVKVSKQTYYFTFDIQQGSIVLGSGRWIGPSVTNHPDFAWYPHTARAENPEINYAAVKRLVDASGSGAAAPTPRPRRQQPRRPDRTTTPSNTPPAPWGRIAVPPNVVPGRLGGADLPPNVMPELLTPASANADQPYVLSPVELLSMVTNRTSSFPLDITIDKFDGGHYTPGEPFSIRGTAEKAGYLYLFYLDTAGQLSVLFPVGGVNNRISPQQRIELPAGGADPWHTANVAGTHRVKAVVTKMPLIMSGLVSTDGQANQPREFRLPPSQQAQYQQILGKHQKGQKFSKDVLGGVSAEQFLGEFAQDEVAFYVGPAAANSDPNNPAP